MAGTPTNVIQSRDIIMYLAAYSASNALPADSAWGTAWGGTYRDAGYTDGGVNVNIGIDYTDVHVDQELDPVLIVASGRNVRLAATLAEPTTANLKDAIGGQGSITTVAATSGVRGHADLDLSPTLSLNYQTVGFDVKHPGDGEAIRVIAWKAQGRGSPQIQFAADSKAAVPFEAQAFPDAANSNRVLRWRDIIAALP
jgi:hypothetical protein